MIGSVSGHPQHHPIPCIARAPGLLTASTKAYPCHDWFHYASEGISRAYRKGKLRFLFLGSFVHNFPIHCSPRILKKAMQSDKAFLSWLGFGRHIVDIMAFNNVDCFDFFRHIDDGRLIRDIFCRFIGPWPFLKVTSFSIGTSAMSSTGSLLTSAGLLMIASD